MKTTKAGALVGVVAFAAVTLSTAGSAHADGAPGDGWDHTWKTDSQPSTSRSAVTGFGRDRKSNGDSASATVWWSGGPDQWVIWADGGTGSCESRRASDGKKYNWREGATININFGGGRKQDSEVQERPLNEKHIPDSDMVPDGRHDSECGRVT